MKIEIAKAIALLTTEYDLKEFTDERIDAWMRALSQFPAGTVTRSVENFMRTSKFKPQLADIVQGCEAQCTGGWLTADEAWARMPKSEADSAMMTNEISEAMAAASPLLEQGDRNAARMAFRAAYERLVELAKVEARRPVYFASFGTEKSQQGAMLASAVQAGQISIDRAIELKPEFGHDIVSMVGVKSHPLLAAPSDKGRAAVKALLSNLKVES